MSNYAALYEGLRIFRNAMLPFIIDQLRNSYGKGWWEAGVRRALGSDVSDTLEKQYNQRYDKSLSVVTRPGKELYEMLDINRFLPIVQANWKQCFAEVFEQRDTTEVWLREINDVRNIVAHSESGDLSDNDTWRAFDTMERLIRIINPAAAGQIIQVKQEAHDVTASRPIWLSLRDGPFDYEQGLAQLEKYIIEQESKESDVYLTFQGYHRQLGTILWEMKFSPGIPDAQLENRKERILRELERLAQHYIGKSFANLCTVVVPPAKPEDSLRRIQELEHDIEKVKDQLYEKQWKKLAQQRSGEIVPRIEREITHIQLQLEQKQAELNHIKETSAPSAFFSVKRQIRPSEGHPFVEEQPIKVLVEITNLGRLAADIQYKEGLSDGLETVNGDLSLEALVGPGATVMLTYTCYGTRPGKHRMFTEYINYEEQSHVWDKTEDTVIEVNAGTEPSLLVTRYYRYELDGLKLLVHLENKGDKIAHNVTYEEEICIEGETEPIFVAFRDDILGGARECTIEQKLPTVNPEKVHFPEQTKIIYSNSQREIRNVTLAPGWKRIEYNFPITPTAIATVGRENEIRLLSEIIDQVWRLARGQSISAPKRLLFIEGIEGVGKTKIVHELIVQAQRQKFNCFVEDAKDRSPMKRMLKQLLRLKPDEDNDKLIWERLRDYLPGKPQQEVVFRFISTLPTKFDQDEVNFLASSVLFLIKTRCQQAPTVLVFENIHWTPEGIEEHLLLKLFEGTLASADEPILLCATYRPAEIGPLPVVDKFKMSRERYEIITLNPIDRESTKKLVDQIVNFPRFSESLYSFICNWSRGNPLYLIELLRLLLHPDEKYLIRINSEWYPAPGLKLEEVIPKTIEEVILARVEQELPSEADFAKIMSAIGFELPLVIIEALVAHEFSEWPLHELNRRLEILEKAGILVMSRSKTQIEGYEFEHQLKREILYKSLPEGRRLQLRKQIAEILLSKRVFSDPGEQIRQLVRHIVKSPREFQVTHLEEIKKAAEMERDLRNFSRSLEFYNAALELSQEKSFELVELLIERNYLYQMRGDWIPAMRDLQQAYSLISSESSLMKQDSKKTKRLRIIVEKEQGRVLLNQPQASLDRANGLLYHARVEMEGFLRLKFFFPPENQNFHRDLVEIYLTLAEVWLRKRNFKVCEEACKCAEKLAQHAERKLKDNSLLPWVYLTVGNLHLELSTKQEEYNQACKWYKLALEYAKDDLYQQERIWIALAEVYQAMGDTNQAYQQYEKAIQLQKKLGDAYGLARSYGGIGNLLVEQQEYEQACYYCQQAYEYQHLIGDLNRFWRTCVSLTKIYLHSGNPDKAGTYWMQSRSILLEQNRFYDLGGRKQQEIYDLIQKFAVHYRKSGQWEESCLCMQDLDRIIAYIKWDQEELTKVQMDLGETYFKTRQWQNAITAFTQALESADSPATRAEAHEWLGDVYAVFEAPTRILNPTANQIQEDSQDQAEYHYEEAVKQLIHTNNILRAVAVYEKLLNRTVTDEAGLLLLPFIFLRILRIMRLEQHTHNQFLDKTLETLLRNELHVEAGDIAVYAAREIAKVDNIIIPFEEKLNYLSRAETLYRQCKPEDLIWGLNMLIPTYLQLGCWEEIVHSVEELFELNIQVEDVDEFIESFRAITILEDKIDIPALERFINLALAGLQRLLFSTGQQMQLFLYVAKNYSYIAERVDKADEPERKLSYEGLALQYYEKVQEMASADTAIVATVLNDSALIYMEREEYQEAIGRLSESIRIDEEFGGRGAAGISRSNRADLYIRMKYFHEAEIDLEIAIEHQTRVVKYWNEQLKHQDNQPLSPAEIFRMRHDKHSFAKTCSTFAWLLLSRGDFLRAQELALQAKQLYQEIGDLKSARSVQMTAAFAILKSGSVSIGEIPELDIKQEWPCPSCQKLLTEGISICPACGQLLCPECGAAVEDNAETCPVCGAEFDLICPVCKHKVSAEDAVCPYCGESFNDCNSEGEQWNFSKD